MPRLAMLGLLCVLAAAPAHADGYYFEQVIGVASGRGRSSAPLSLGLHSKLGVGLKRGGFSIEPWIASDLTFDRDSATLDIFGGAPAAGRADLEGTGIDLRYTYRLPRGLALYVRGGPRFATGAGALGGFDGPGFGVGTGLALTGRVRALGFLWAPLFFFHEGPYAVGAIFIDQGVDVYTLTGPPAGTRLVSIVGTDLGVAIGTDF